MNAAAQGDLCSGATLIACGATVTGNTGFPYTVDAAPVCTTTNGTGGGVWYRFVGTGVSTTASLCGSGYDTKIRVYSGTCAALVCAVGNDDFCGTRSQVTWTTVSGTTYYILVHGFGAATGAYTLTITCAPPPVPMCYSQTTVPYNALGYTGTPLALTDDLHSAVIPIGFSFCYNGTTYTQLVISSNNYVSFDPTVAGTFSPWVTVAVPAAAPTQIKNSILNPWQDINPGVGGNIYYKTIGVAPYRRFVVSYLNVPMYSCTQQLYSSQTVLYESSNCIGSHIQNKPICTTWNSGNAVHALHNNAANSATIVAGRNNTQWTVLSAGRLFTPTCAPCSTAATSTCLSSILPIELLKFTGRSEGPVNILEWATASEENSATFTIERSPDGEAFIDVVTILAAGTSHEPILYAAKDDHPIPGINYYRLRGTDLDGAETTSDMISVVNANTTIVLAPNPAAGAVSYHLPEGTGFPATIVISDATGREVRRAIVNTTQGELDLHGLPPGCFMVKIPGGGAASTVVVQ